MFETVVLGLGGAEFYQAALVDLDPEALTSDTMIAAFDQMRTMRGYVDPNFSGRDWNLATAMVMNGEAAFQIMGDWAKVNSSLLEKCQALISHAPPLRVMATSTT